MAIKVINRNLPQEETREGWLGKAIQVMRPWFPEVEIPEIPEKVRVSCGWPSQRALSEKKRRIGECWSATLSGDQTSEIFISPYLGDPIEVLGTLTHELIHAAVGVRAGHRKPFSRAAKAIGLEKPWTATKPGDDLTERLQEVAKELGPYPHDRLAGMECEFKNPKKQSTRLLKAICPECGYTVRVTKTWIEQGLPVCSLCKVEFICPDLEEDEEEEDNE